MCGAGGRIFRVCLLMLLTVTCFRDMMCKPSLGQCQRAEFFQSAEYERDKNRTWIGLSTYATVTCAVIENDSLTLLYPWIKVSNADPELTLARSQLQSLMDLVAAFPEAASVSITHIIGDEDDSVDISIDWQTVTFFENVSVVSDASSEISEEKLRPYFNRESFVTFVQSKSVVLQRWRKVCEEAMKRDVRDGVNMTFVYYPANETLSCHIRLWGPVFYVSRLECVEPDASENGIVLGDMDVDLKGEMLVWNKPRCNLTKIKCVFESTTKWRREIFPVVVSEGVVDAFGRSPASRAGVVVAIVAALIVSVLVLLACYRYGSKVRFLNDVFVLVRDRRRIREDGYRQASAC